VSRNPCCRYAPRDITLLVYLLLSAAIFMTRALPLSALVLVLNICNLSVCLALKGEQVVGLLHAWLGASDSMCFCDQELIVTLEAWVQTAATLPPHPASRRHDRRAA